MNPNLNLNFILRAVFLTFSLRIDACLWTLVATLGNCPLKYFFHGISASTDSSHIGEKSDNKGDGGGHNRWSCCFWPQAIVFTCLAPLDMTQKIFQVITSEIALLEVFQPSESVHLKYYMFTSDKVLFLTGLAVSLCSQLLFCILELLHRQKPTFQIAYLTFDNTYLCFEDIWSFFENSFCPAGVRKK